MGTPTTTPSAANGPSTDSEHPYRYTAALADDLETRWQAHWDSHQTFRTPAADAAGGPKFYCLDMFPYPSGSGLHVGHPEGYTATDIICRYKRHRGFRVLHPMGWDAFGLPAEQYAIQTGVHPSITTRKAIDTFRRQLQRFGFSYDWSREFATIDPDYYRWTQWIWLQAYDAWYDGDAQRARRIAELEGEFASGGRPVAFDPEAPAGVVDSDDAGRTFGAWAEVDTRTRKRILDSYRLAYISTQTVNWCPKLGTALANEEVIDGKSERGGFPVLRKPLRQWMFRITAFADRLLAALDDVKWPESTRTMQAEWIGRSEGAEVDFPLADPVAGFERPIRIYTTRPDTIFGASYMVLAPEHPLVTALLASPPDPDRAEGIRAYVEEAASRSDVDRLASVKEKTGVFTGANAINPATGERVPIWVADYVLMGYGHGAIMAVPAHDLRDWQFARQFDIPCPPVVEPPADWTPSAEEAAVAEAVGGGASPPFSGWGTSINSANDDVSLDGLSSRDAKTRITGCFEQRGIGRRKINYRLRDWLFSRQRYWGEPIPIVIDEHGDHYPVDAAHLPVVLPEMDDYTPVESDTPMPLLAKATDWVETTAGAAGVDPAVLPADTPVRRETNTMPGWAGSCWYYLRFCDPHNDERFVSREAERAWMLSTKSDDPATRPADGEAHDTNRHHVGGVDLYIGGAEHAVLHLLYARFWHMILFDLGEVSTPEPFGKLFHQGMITSFAYQRADKSLVPVDEVEERGEGTFVETATGQTVTQITAKMSKSLRNVVNPDDVIAEYGADTFRLYEMYMGPLEQSKPWNPRDIVGPFRFLQRAWRLAVDEQTGTLVVRDEPDAAVEKQLHRTIARVEQDIERLAFNTAIAALIELVNAATTAGGLTRDQLERFAVLLSPFAPHLAEEIWARLGHDPSIAAVPWPGHDPAMLKDDEIELPVQIMGKVRGRITVPADATQEQVEAAALADPQIAALLEGKTVRKVVVVPGKIVNIVAPG